MSLHILDTRQLGHAGIVAATALETNDGLALFDTGPESTFDNVIGDLRKAGFDAKDVRHVFLSHIHFDHAGAAWRFAQSATIYVHPRGAPHLIDPAKLVESATRIFGADMDRLWGKIVGVPKERVKILEDNDVVRVPPFAFRAIATPGHASHHHVYHWNDNVFGGDIAGVRIGNGPPIPPFVPPELHVESWRESIARIRNLNPANLYLPHFGKVEGPISEHLDLLDERVARWSEWFRDKIRNGINEDQLRLDFATLEHSEIANFSSADSSLITRHMSLVTLYEAADPSYMAPLAAIRYWKKYHPEAIGS
ncbi:MAG TPA: MBL fold metallo-hydrolase [Chthoniobacterales bacterium]|nr:MBL fold metallo-hydrolase [Chthoniobacterales bacterium]